MGQMGVNDHYLGWIPLFLGFSNSVNETFLNSSDCRASKIIWNDTKVEPISWEPKRENLISNFCVGVWVGCGPYFTWVWYLNIYFSETLNYLWRHRQRFRIWHDYDSLCEGISSIFQQFWNQETKERFWKTPSVNK